MIEQPTVHIICPGCDCAVNTLDGAPCPNCHRCSICGRKLQPEESCCDCAFVKDPAETIQQWSKYIIPEDQVARETHRMEIRKQLESKRIWVATGVITLAMTLHLNLHRELFGPWTWASFVVFLICGTIGIMLMTSILDGIFKIIEDRRLETQFDWPDEARNDG